MLAARPFSYVPSEYESERASNSYLMALVVLMVGLPLPIINLIASVMFYLGNRKGTFFVRWHCTQALLTQALTLVVNAAGVYWTLSVLFGEGRFTNAYCSYMITIIIVNLVEFVATLYTASRTRKGIHVSWWFFGSLTDHIVHT